MQPQKFTVTAPTRADLAGGTLDIWPLYTLVGGAKTINIALDLCAKASFEVTPHAHFRVEIQAGNGDAYFFDEPMALDQAKKLPPMVRFPVAVTSRFLTGKTDLPDARIRIHLDTGVPPQSGLGGSSTLCVALVRGLARLFNDFVELGWQFKMLEWVRDMEASYLNMLTGNQDYLAALFGGVSCYVSGIGHLEKVNYAPEVFDGFAQRALILYSGEMHDSGISNWEIIKGAIEREPSIVKGMHAIRQIADGLDAELASGNLSWKHIGQYLNEEWDARENLFRVHTKRLDEIVQFLASKKVLGAKVCGAAAGGSLLALVDPAQREAVAQDCERHGIRVLRTQCTRQGVTVAST